jgi:cardiolipin synthase
MCASKETAMNRHTLYTKVQDYYHDLAMELATARTEISMSYLAFEDGRWARAIAEVLHSRVKDGVRVRLMVDAFGQLTDEPNRWRGNFEILNHLRSLGVQVNIFQPASPLTIGNRIHAKFAAIDDRTAFLGGSNIGDYYTTWTDTNLRVDGDLQNVLHRVYDFLHSHSRQGRAKNRALDPANLKIGDARLWLTVPQYRYDIRARLLNLIRDPGKSIFIRTWYFLPDNDILTALCEQAGRGVQVNVLLSHKTRIRAVDFANHIHVHRLVCAGANVHRYTGRYMHCKAAWNDRGDALIGSANLNSNSMTINFETCLEIHDSKLTGDLRRAFYADLANSPRQTPDSYLKRSLADKALTHACNLASPWL